MRMAAPPVPWGLSLLCWLYWLCLAVLALLLLTSALLVVKRVLWPRKLRVTRPSRQGDTEAALMDTLHLLDAVMKKVWRRLQHLEKRRRGEGHSPPGRIWS